MDQLIPHALSSLILINIKIFYKNLELKYLMLLLMMGMLLMLLHCLFKKNHGLLKEEELVRKIFHRKKLICKIENFQNKKLQNLQMEVNEEHSEEKTNPWLFQQMAHKTNHRNNHLKMLMTFKQSQIKQKDKNHQI